MFLFIAIVISAFLLNLLLPWWSIAIPGFIFGYFYSGKELSAFGWGFLALFLLWGIQTIYIDMANSSILSERIAEMMGIGSPYILIFATALIGGLVSGLATLTGRMAKSYQSKTAKT